MAQKTKINFTLVLIGVVVLICIWAYVHDARKMPKAVSRDTIKSEAYVLDIAKWKDVPQIEFHNVDGKTFHLDDYKGKIVLLNFWTSWCPPCVIEFPSLLRLITKYEGKVVLVAISNDERREDIDGYLEQFEGQFSQELKSPHLKIAWDRDKHIAQDIFHTEMYPETIIITKDGKMARKVVGDIEWDGENMVKYLDKLIALNSGS